VPDWRSVAEEWDAVHLSWAGFLTGEARVADLSEGGVAMIRFWLGERVLWLRDCFGEPEPMARLALAEHPPNGVRSVDAGSDPWRERDRTWLTTMLGR
jgi:hypothetical protein